MSVVYIKKVSHFREVRAILNRVNLNIAHKRILLKPNIVVAAKAKSGIVTDPALVKELIYYFRENGFNDIVIAESPGQNVNFDEAVRISGYRRLCDEENISLIDLDRAEKQTITWQYGNINIPKIILDSFYINMPKLKTHMNTTVSLALKNQKGIISHIDQQRFHNKWGLHKPIAMLAKAVKPDLVIIDGKVGLQGEGPLFSGKPLKTGLIIVSKDILSADAAACRIMGIEPQSVVHIRIAFQEKLGDISPEIIGDRIELVARKFKKANESYFKFFKLTKWRSPYTCCICDEPLRTALQMIIGKPKFWLEYLPKLLWLVFIEGVDFLTGNFAKIPEKHGKLVFWGNCTKDLSSHYDGIWIKGCPPSPEEFLKGFLK